MGLKDNLCRAIRSGEELAKNCRLFAGEAGTSPAASVFSQMAEGLNDYIRDLKKELKKYCGP